MNTEIGPFFPSRDQPKLSFRDARVVRRFHQLYYNRWLAHGDTINLSWFGYHLLKCPLDLWMYQELIVRNRPDYVVETGTWAGGSALYLAMLFDHLDRGQVITIDIEPRPERPAHPRITYVTGSSVDQQVAASVREAVGDRRAMVILDSDHRADHVYEELMAYSSLVKPGDYLIVEDTNVNKHPVAPHFGPGPMEAVEKFLSQTDEFVIDERCERFLMTLQPRGYLRRV